MIASPRSCRIAATVELSTPPIMAPAVAPAAASTETGTAGVDSILMDGIFSLLFPLQQGTSPESAAKERPGVRQQPVSRRLLARFPPRWLYGQNESARSNAR